MKRTYLMMVIFVSASMLNACVGLPNLGNMFYPIESDKPDYARGGRDNTASKGRVPLDVPPELRKEIEVPMPDKVATEAAQGGKGLSSQAKKLIAGKAVSLDAREYDVTPARIFSSVVDSMTALNMPVDSVDSPSGTITTTWIRLDSSKANAYVGSVMNMFGAGPAHTRHRFVVRVFRMQDGKTQLQIRTLAQQFLNRHWVNKILKRKVANELFSAVEERIGSPVSGNKDARPPTEKSQAKD